MLHEVGIIFHKSFIGFIGGRTFYTENEKRLYSEEERMKQNLIHALEQKNKLDFWINNKMPKTNPYWNEHNWEEYLYSYKT